MENFRSLYQQYPNATVRRSGDVFELSVSLRNLPEAYVYQGKRKKISEWIERTDATGLLAIKDGTIVFEEYYKGNRKSTRFIHPKYNVVIAKTSAYSDYNNSGDEMEFESMAVFRHIAKNL